MSETLAKMQAIEFAFIKGIERAKRQDLRKPYDVHICIRTELKRAGLTIVWAKGQK